MAELQFAACLPTSLAADEAEYAGLLIFVGVEEVGRFVAHRTEPVGWFKNREAHTGNAT